MNNDNKTTIWILGVIVLTILVIIGVSRYKSSSESNINPINSENINTDTVSPPTGSNPANANVNPKLKPIDNNIKKNMEYPTKLNETVERQDGLKITMLAEGAGTAVSKVGDSILVSYKGMLEDGTVFDQGTLPPMVVGAPGLIVGFDRGMTGMKVGETRRVFIPSELGYGAHGAGSVIKPNTNLVFEITLKEIK
ncbi:MAG: FKBP-type peptidyl-prolyl cis-trans isomerase [Minisyncoccia bacterium]